MTVGADETHTVDVRLTVIKPFQRAKIKFIKYCCVTRTLITDATFYWCRQPRQPVSQNSKVDPTPAGTDVFAQQLFI